MYCAKYGGNTYVTISMKYGLRANSNNAHENPAGAMRPPTR